MVRIWAPRCLGADDARAAVLLTGAPVTCLAWDARADKVMCASLAASMPSSRNPITGFASSARCVEVSTAAVHSKSHLNLMSSTLTPISPQAISEETSIDQSWTRWLAFRPGPARVSSKHLPDSCLAPGTVRCLLQHDKSLQSKLTISTGPSNVNLSEQLPIDGTLQ